MARIYFRRLELPDAGIGIGLNLRPILLPNFYYHSPC
jgi:hypothetical protein